MEPIFFGEDKNESGYRNLPIEEKEYNKWLVATQQSKEWLNGGNSITLVGDKENDIYEYFALVPDEGVDVLVRLSWQGPRTRIKRSITNYVFCLINP